MAQRINQLLEKSASFRTGLNQILRDTLPTLDPKFRTILNGATPSLIVPARLETEVCPVCGNTSDNADLAVDHILYNHYDVFKTYPDILVCSECAAMGNGIDGMFPP